jgi:thiopeptide-type bacteriocin biosynthesis protein
VEAIETLAHLPDPPPRAWEIWPPLDRLADADGRRVEAVVAVVAAPGTTPAPPRAVALVEPAPDPAWRTFLLYGAPDRADRLLVEHVGPTLAAGRERGEIGGWFFLRYIDAGGRDHLRLRVRASGDPAARSVDERGLERFATRLARRLAPARARGDLVAIESAEYRPERARYGGPKAMPLVEEMFQSDSELCLGLLALDEALRPDGPTLLVRSFDALAAGLGLDLDGRRGLAAELRGAQAAVLRPDPTAPDPFAPLYREHQAGLCAALARDRALRPTADGDPAAPLLRAHALRLREIRRRLDRALGRTAARRLLPSLLPSLLHLAAVRLVGTAAEHAAIGAYLWQRALESLGARSRDSKKGLRDDTQT